MDESDIDRLSINTIRTLAMDAVQKANSGHPGTPMGMAPVGYALWQKRLNYDPADADWPNRDRFVLSAGHACMLLYALLHLAKVQRIDKQTGKLTGGPAVSLDDIKSFRQIDSVTPGHPEYERTTGVEATTGPLGQGYANSVGFAMAERWLAVHFNRPDFPIIDYHTYALGGDGCMMEGISNEAASLAGHLALGNLCWIYDSNRITIEGSTELAFSENVATRFLGLGWNVLTVRDANNEKEFLEAIDQANAETDKPTLIIVDSHIAYGSPHKQDSAAAHGEPLGEDEVRLTKKFYGWPEDAHFLVPDGVYDNFAKGLGARGAKRHAEWQEMFARYRKAYPDLADEFEAMQRGALPKGWDFAIPTFPADAKGLASRDASGKVENAIAQKLPWFVGGAADLAPSTKTLMTFEGAGSFEPGDHSGRNMHFGIREHAMGAAVNGMALSKLRAFGATFLTFSEYMRTPIRLAAMMEISSIFVFTHDSISVGEDGPTHEPIEQLPSLRAIPGLITLRPCDANETAEAWKVILKLDHQPVCLILSRQTLPTLDRSRLAPASGLTKGAYVLGDLGNGPPQIILMGTGSEVSLCVAAAEALAANGTPARVVSMPSWELFEQQPEAYQQEVLPDSIVARAAVEQAAVLGWDRYVGRYGAIVGMRSFGASAPGKDVQKKFGFTPEHVLQVAKEQIATQDKRRGK